MSDITPTLDTIIAATGGHLSRDGKGVIVSYGTNGDLALSPSTIIREGREMPAVRIDGKLHRRNGGLQAELRARLRAAGLEIR